MSIECVQGTTRFAIKPVRLSKAYIHRSVNISNIIISKTSRNVRSLNFYDTPTMQTRKWHENNRVPSELSVQLIIIPVWDEVCTPETTPEFAQILEAWPYPRIPRDT